MSYLDMIQPISKLNDEQHAAYAEFLAYAAKTNINPYTAWATIERRHKRPFSKREAAALRPDFRAVLGRAEEQALFTAFMVVCGYKPCARCNCTGDFVWGTFVNGMPTKRGACFNCAGEGYTKKAQQQAI